MFKNFSPSLFFAMAAVTVVVFAPFIMLFQPVFQSFIFVKPYEQDVYLINPINLRLVIVACLVFGVLFGLLAYKRTKMIYGVSMVLLVLGGSMLYFSTQNYLKIDSEKIERSFLWMNDEYEWTELDEVYYEYVVGANKGEVKLVAKTGESFVIKEKELNSQAKSYIYQYSNQNGIPYVEREKMD